MKKKRPNLLYGIRYGENNIEPIATGTKLGHIVTNDRFLFGSLKDIKVLES